MNMVNLCVPTIFIFTLIPIFLLFIVGGSEAGQKMSTLLKPLNSSKMSPAQLYAECNELCASKRFDEMIKNLQDKIPICKIFPDKNGAVDYGYLFSSIQELMDNIEEHQKVLKGTHHTGHWTSSEEYGMEVQAKKYLKAIADFIKTLDKKLEARKKIIFSYRAKEVLDEALYCTGKIGQLKTEEKKEGQNWEEVEKTFGEEILKICKEVVWEHKEVKTGK